MRTQSLPMYGDAPPPELRKPSRQVKLDLNIHPGQPGLMIRPAKGKSVAIGLFGPNTGNIL